MRGLYLVIICQLSFFSNSQEGGRFQIPPGSFLSKLKTNDSMVVYQCHVDSVVSSVTVANGKEIKGPKQRATLTDKFVITRRDSGYHLSYYTSALTAFPNKKFSGLKIREREYWQFIYQGKRKLSEKEIKYLVGLEKKGHDAIEFDFVINKYNSNQLILKHRKDFRQLVLESDHVYARLLKL